MRSSIFYLFSIIICAYINKNNCWKKNESACWISSNGMRNKIETKLWSTSSRRSQKKLLSLHNWTQKLKSLSGNCHKLLLTMNRCQRNANELEVRLLFTSQNNHSTFPQQKKILKKSCFFQQEETFLRLH